MTPSESSRHTSRALLLMLLATVFLASMHGLVRHLGQDLNALVVVFFRNFFGLIAVLPLLLRVGLRSLATQRPGLHFLRALIGVGAMFSWFYALIKVPIANATALSFTAAIFASLAAFIFLGERMRLRRWSAIIVGLIGAVIVIRPGTEGFNQYSLLVVGSTVFWGISVTIVKKLSETETTVTIVSWMGILMTVGSFIPALFVWQWPSGMQWWLLLATGALGTAGHLCMTKALSLAEAAAVMSVDFSRLIWTTFIGVYFFGELIDAWTVTGALIIFASGLYIIFRESAVKRRGENG